MYTFIIVILIIVSILLALIVLVQNSKGGGLAAGFNASTQIMGVRKTSDLLEKLTWGFAILLITLAIVGNLVLPKGTSTANKSLLQDQIENLPSASPTQAPAPTGGAQPVQPAQPAPAPAK